MIGAEFSDEDFETLSDWLLHRGKGITDIVELEGFLTAIVIGPNTLSPLTWLPKVWGGKHPDFKDLEEMNRFVALVMRFYNSIVLIFETSPEQFEPTFYERKIRGRSRSSSSARAPVSAGSTPAARTGCTRPGRRASRRRCATFTSIWLLYRRRVLAERRGPQH